MKLKKRIKRSIETFLDIVTVTYVEFHRQIFTYRINKYVSRYIDSFMVHGGSAREGIIDRSDVPNKLFDRACENSGWLSTKIRRYGYRFFRIYRHPEYYRITYYVEK